MSRQLHRWLNNSNPPYQEGLEIFREVGNNSAMLHLLSLGATRHNARLLRTELTRVARVLQPHPDPMPARAAEKKPASPPVVSTPRPAAPPTEDEVAETVDALRKIMKEAFKRANYLHLVDLASEKEEVRKNAAREILELFDGKIVQITNQLQYYEKHKQLPVDHYLAFKKKKKTVVELMQDRNNLRSRMSKYKNRPDKQADLLLWAAEIKDLDKQLDAFQ